METIKETGWRKTLCNITATDEESVEKAYEARKLLDCTWNEIFFIGVDTILKKKD